MDEISVQIGDHIRQLRLEQRISQTELARRAGIHSKYLGEIERAEKHVTVDRLYKIVQALDTPLSKFFQGIDE